MRNVTCQSYYSYGHLLIAMGKEGGKSPLRSAALLEVRTFPKPFSSIRCISSEIKIDIQHLPLRLSLLHQHNSIQIKRFHHPSFCSCSSQPNYMVAYVKFIYQQ